MLTSRLCCNHTHEADGHSVLKPTPPHSLPICRITHLSLSINTSLQLQFTPQTDTCRCRLFLRRIVVFLARSVLPFPCLHHFRTRRCHRSLGARSRQPLCLLTSRRHWTVCVRQRLTGGRVCPPVLCSPGMDAKKRPDGKKRQVIESEMKSSSSL